MAFPIALGAGAISFLSPCVLPLVPAYVSYITGRSIDELTDRDGGAAPLSLLVPATTFVLGFTVVFVLLGASASAVNRLLITHMETISRIAGVIIILFGLHYMGALRIPLINREARWQMSAPRSGLGGAFLLGVAFAFGWTPCIGPVLATILTLAASKSSLAWGMTLLAVYSLGLGIPFVGAALAVGRFTHVSGKIRPHLRKIEIVAGLLLVTTGLLILFGSLQRLGFYLLEVFPWLAQIG